MKITSSQTLGILIVVAWVIFVGICIEAGGFITNSLFAIFNPGMVKYLWHEVDLSDLFNYDHGYFSVVTLLMGIVAIMKAILFYLIVKILHHKRATMTRSFDREIGQFILKMSYLSLAIGLFSFSGVNFIEWLTKQGVEMPDVHYLRLAGADVWIFMAVTLFVIFYVYKRGIEIQEEHELTV